MKASARSQLRSVRRLLARGTLPRGAQAAQERLARELEARVAAQERQEKERKLSTRYHMVRFFDRQKLTRALRQAEKSLAAAGERGSADLELRVAALREDLDYVQNFPKGEVYVSVVKANDEETRTKVAQLKQRIREERAERAALTDADEGVREHGGTVGQKGAKFFSQDEADDFFEYDGHGGEDAGGDRAPSRDQISEEGEKKGRRTAHAGGVRRDASTSGGRGERGGVSAWEERSRGAPVREGRSSGRGTKGAAGRSPNDTPGRGQVAHRSEYGKGGKWEQPKREGSRVWGDSGGGGADAVRGARGARETRGHKREQKPVDPEAAAKAAEKVALKKQVKERVQAGLPLRTRAEGGRKRRKRK